MYSYLVGRANPCICIWSEEQIHVLGYNPCIRLYLLWANPYLVRQRWIPYTNFTFLIIFVLKSRIMTAKCSFLNVLKRKRWIRLILRRHFSEIAHESQESAPKISRITQHQIHVFTPKTKSMYSYLVRGANPCIRLIRICPNPTGLE